MTTDAWVQVEDEAASLCHDASSRTGIQHSEAYWDWCCKSSMLWTPVTPLSARLDAWAGYALSVFTDDGLGRAAGCWGSDRTGVIGAAVEDAQRSLRPHPLLLPLEPYVEWPDVTAAVDTREIDDRLRGILEHVRTGFSDLGVTLMRVKSSLQLSRVGHVASYRNKGSYGAIMSATGFSVLSAAGHAVAGSVWGASWPLSPDLQQTIEAIAQKATRSLPRVQLDLTGQPVVLSPRAFARLLSGTWTVFRDEFSWNQVGKKVAASDLTIVDNPLNQGYLASAPFDAEGYPSRRTILLDEGVVAGRLRNRSQARDGVNITASGMREGYWSDIVCMPTNLMVQPGNAALADLMQGRVLYVEDCNVVGPGGVCHDSSEIHALLDGVILENGVEVADAGRSRSTVCLCQLLRQVVCCSRETETWTQAGVFVAPAVRVEWGRDSS